MHDPASSSAGSPKKIQLLGCNTHNSKNEFGQWFEDRGFDDMHLILEPAGFPGCCGQFICVPDSCGDLPSVL